MMCARRRPLDGDDSGTVMILVIFFAVIIAGLITVVVDVSTVFLARRELQSVADGATISAAQQADLHGVYGGQVAAALPLSAADVDGYIANYVVDPAHLPHECHAVPDMVAAVPDGQTVILELSCKVPLPFVQLVSHMWSDGVTIHVFAQARTVVTAAG